MDRRLLSALALALALVVAVPPLALAEDEATVKVSVLNTTKFTSLSAYMFDSSANKLVDINTSYVQVLDYELKDLDASDSYQPAVVLPLDAPTTDLNTNESIIYAWVLRGAYGDGIVIAVADINSTDNSIINMSYYKLSPVSGDIAIFRTSYDIVAETGGVKLSIPLENFTNPKVLLMAEQGADFLASSINYVELRALRSPPSGFNLIRSGTGEAEFTISASGSLQIWFDESHSGGDVDLFVFDQSHPQYASASTSVSWGQLEVWAATDPLHAASLWADASPTVGSIEATGTVKLIVKRYSGDANSVSWRVAAYLSNTQQPQPQPTTPTQTQQPQPVQTPEASPSGLMAQIQGALGGHNAVIYAALFLVFLLALIVALRR